MYVLSWNLLTLYDFYYFNLAKLNLKFIFVLNSIIRLKKPRLSGV